MGNSLTAETITHVGFDLAQLTSAKDLNAQLAWHIRCGSQLSQTVANPENTCLDPMQPYGYFGTALPNYQWDAVTLQPYGDAMPDGRAAANSLINLTRQLPANASTNFYVFSAWPQGASPDTYATRWTRAYDESVDDPESRWSRQYADTLLQHLRTDQPGAKIGMVLSGEMMYQFDVLARAGEIAHYASADQLYYNPDTGGYDPLHGWVTLSYISRLTMFTTLYRECPIGLPVPTNVNLTADDALQVQQMVWNTVTSNWSKTLVLAADATKDGRVDTGDFNILAGNFGSTSNLIADGNFSGTGGVDSIDFGILLASYGRNVNAAIPTGTPVPEPATAGAFLAVIGLFCRRGRRGIQ